MLLETLLPLGKVDPSLRAPELPLDLHSSAAEARLLDEIGYDGLVVEETKDDPFVVLALAAQMTRTLKLGTSVAVKNDADRERLRQLASGIQSESVAPARRTILGVAAE